MNWRTEFGCALLVLASPAAAVTTCNGANASLAFGVYDGFATAHLDTQSNIVVTCTRIGGPPTATISIALGPSVSSGAIAIRYLRGPDQLNYNLFRDATRSTIWGNTTGVDTVTQSLTLANNATGSTSFTVFGRIFAQQDVRVGTYADSLLITVSY